MKIAVQYVNDSKGQTQAIQVPLAEWEKILAKLKKYEQALQIRTDLKEALEQVKPLKASKAPKQTLKDFLNEL